MGPSQRGCRCRCFHARFRERSTRKASGSSRRTAPGAFGTRHGARRGALEQRESQALRPSRTCFKDTENAIQGRRRHDVPLRNLTHPHRAPHPHRAHPHRAPRARPARPHRTPGRVAPANSAYTSADRRYGSMTSSSASATPAVQWAALCGDFAQHRSETFSGVIARTVGRRADLVIAERQAAIRANSRTVECAPHRARGMMATASRPVRPRHRRRDVRLEQQRLGEEPRSVRGGVFGTRAGFEDGESTRGLWHFVPDERLRASALDAHVQIIQTSAQNDLRHRRAADVACRRSGC